MSIASEIQRLQGVKSSIVEAIEEKGVTVPAGSALADCPRLIGSIVTGSGGVIIGNEHYNVVDMPDGRKWLGANLDLAWDGLTIGGGSTSATQAANYYENDYSHYGILGNRYGLLYNFNAVQYLVAHPEMTPGFHVPTKAEWENLKNALIAIDSVNPWSLIISESDMGSDVYGFNAFATGHRDYYGNFYGVGSRCTFWTASSSGGSAWDVWVELNSIGFGSDGYHFQHALRLVSD